MAVGVQTDICTPALTTFGSHELKEHFLRPTIAGDFVGCLGVSEPDAGSDVAGIKTKAVKQGGRCTVCSIDEDFILLRHRGKLILMTGDIR